MDEQEDKESKYFKMSDAWDEVSYGVGAGEKAKAGLKMLGKGLFNFGKFVATEAVPKMVEQSIEQNVNRSSQLLKNENLTDEQRNRLEEIRDQSNQARADFKR